MWIVKVSLSDKESIALQSRLNEISPNVLNSMETNVTPLDLRVICEFQALTKILKGNGKHEVEK